MGVKMKRYSWGTIKVPLIFILAVFIIVLSVFIYQTKKVGNIDQKVSEYNKKYVDTFIINGVNKYRVTSVEKDESGGYVVNELYNYRDIQSKFKKMNIEDVLMLLEDYEYSNKEEDNSPYLVLESKKGNCQAVSLFIYDFLEANFNSLNQELIETNTPFHLYNKISYNDKTYLIDMSKDRRGSINQLRLLIADLI